MSYLIFLYDKISCMIIFLFDKIVVLIKYNGGATNMDICYGRSVFKWHERIEVLKIKILNLFVSNSEYKSSKNCSRVNLMKLKYSAVYHSKALYVIVNSYLPAISYHRSSQPLLTARQDIYSIGRHSRCTATNNQRCLPRNKWNGIVKTSVPRVRTRTWQKITEWK